MTTGRSLAPLRAHDPTFAGSYRMLGRLGQGGTAVVYLGQDSDGRRAAVKILKPEVSDDADGRARLAREVTLSRRVPRFCTAEVLGYDIEGEFPFIVTEFIPGPTLGQQVNQDGPLSGAELDRLAISTAVAVVSIHAANVVHCDLKPANVILGPDWPRIIDFGISRDVAAGGDSQIDRTILGSPAYMSPERYQNIEVGPPADIFGWAATIAFAATGRPPFGHDSAIATMRRVIEQPPKLSGLSAGLDHVLRRCLDKDPAARPVATELLTSLLTSGVSSSESVVQPTDESPLQVHDRESIWDVDTRVIARSVTGDVADRAPRSLPGGEPMDAAVRLAGHLTDHSQHTLRLSGGRGQTRKILTRTDVVGRAAVPLPSQDSAVLPRAVARAVVPSPAVARAPDSRPVPVPPSPGEGRQPVAGPPPVARSSGLPAPPTPPNEPGTKPTPVGRTWRRLTRRGDKQAPTVATAGSAADPADSPRVLLAHLPSHAPLAGQLHLVVRVARRGNDLPGTSQVDLDRLLVGPRGTAITVIVQTARSVTPAGPLEQIIHVPPDGDSEPVLFTFVTRSIGLQKVRLTAWTGGTFLAELTCEVSVSDQSGYVDAPPRTAPLDSLTPVPGEVTLQVQYDGSRYRFQLLSDQQMFSPVLVESFAGQPGQAVERAIVTLDGMAKGGSAYSGATSRRMMRQAGINLWDEMVPTLIKEQFWQLRSSVSAFSIASGSEVIPWELLYPRERGHDEGFLVEQFPVLRRVYNQPRSRSVSLAAPRFVVPDGSPADADLEIAAIRKVLGLQHVEPAVQDLEVLLDLLESGAVGMTHFACHNYYRADGGGSSIKMRNGPFTPVLLSEAVTLKSLEHTNPLVFINACRSAGAAPQYTQMMGWAQQFMAAGAGAFVGTLWAVRSSSAATFAEAFYEELTAGSPLGEAARRARVEAGKDPSDPTWLAYSIYGDPAARVASGQRQP